MPIHNAIASLAVKDLKSASQWYERLFGRPPDSKPMPEVVEWKFEAGGWLQRLQSNDNLAQNQYGQASFTTLQSFLTGTVATFSVVPAPTVATETATVYTTR